MATLSLSFGSVKQSTRDWLINDTELFSLFLEAEKYEIRTSEDSVSVEELLHSMGSPFLWLSYMASL